MAIGYCFGVGVCFRALSAPAAVAGVTELKLVVDAGHGGIDGGVVGVKTKRKESDVNLSIAYLLKDRLTDAGFSVTMTRTTDQGLYGTTLPGIKRRDLEKRKEICERAAPTFVVSIHQNFYPSHPPLLPNMFFLLLSAASNGIGRIYVLYSVRDVYVPLLVPLQSLYFFLIRRYNKDIYHPAS